MIAALIVNCLALHAWFQQQGGGLQTVESWVVWLLAKLIGFAWTVITFIPVGYYEAIRDGKAGIVVWLWLVEVIATWIVAFWMC
jgi:hypothetical protein